MHPDNQKQAQATESHYSLKSLFEVILQGGITKDAARYSTEAQQACDPTDRDKELILLGLKVLLLGGEESGVLLPLLNYLQKKPTCEFAWYLISLLFSETQADYSVKCAIVAYHLGNEHTKVKALTLMNTCLSVPLVLSKMTNQDLKDECGLLWQELSDEFHGLTFQKIVEAC
ncbi:MAG: hypothetical protein NWR72_17815 [Bacteroidia bacterium]|nr:hypothetical protein [Bacteroidia bacterium]